MWHKFDEIIIFLSIFSLVRSEDLLKELRQLKNMSTKPSFHRSKRAIREHFSDIHCLSKFETSEQTIIRTVESQKNGANFLNVTTMDSFELCLANCCETQLCNVAIYDEQVMKKCLFTEQ